MKKIINISIWLTLSELTFNLSGYIIHAGLGRFLGPDEYGRFSLIITFSTMVIILIGRGVPISMSKYLSEFMDNKDKVLSVKKQAAIIQFFIIFAITIAYFLLAPVFAMLLSDQSLIPLFRISSLIIPSFALASFYIYYFNGIQAFNRQSALKFSRAGSKIFLILGAGIAFKTVGAIIGQAVAPLVVFATAYVLDPLRKYKQKIKLSPQEKKDIRKKILNFAWPIITFMIFYELMITIDLYLVKALLKSDYLTGIYNSALTVGRIPYYAFYFLTILLLPKISKTVSQNLKKETKQIITIAFRFLFMLLIPSIFILSYFSQSALSFFYGNQYISATPAMSVLVFGLGILTVFYILTFVLNGAGKNKAPMVLSIVGAVINTVLNYFFIKRWGLVGAAWATTFTATIITSIAIFYSSMKITPFLQPLSIAKYIIASIIIYVLAGKFIQQGRLSFILWSIILFLLYLMILFILREFNKKDIKKFISLISKK